MTLSLPSFIRFLMRAVGLLVLLLGASLLTQGQTIRYVKPTATGNGDGSSWANASGNLQAIIVNASVNASGVQQQVWVAAGTYKPTTTGDRNASFALWADVTVYGGFVGNEASLSARPTINLTTPSSTTLSGDIGAPGNADNSYHVIRNSIGLATTAILDGFVITGGNADGSNGSDNDKGGGILLKTNQQNQTASPLIRNCSFQANSAVQGGAMFNRASHIASQSSPTLINCSFQANTASSSGGAMYNSGLEASAGLGGGDSSPTLTNCIFLSNAASTGGAMYNEGFGGFGKSNPKLTNCSFQTNTAGDGGAMYNGGYNGGRSYPTLTNCSFQANSASGGTNNRGGAIFNDGRSSVSSPTLTNCSFQANTASYKGGAMYSMTNAAGESNAELTNCVLFNNGGANTFSNDGGYVYVNSSLFDASVTGFSNRTGVNLSVSVSPFASPNNTPLAANSPAINTGDPATTTATVGATDLAGNPRIVGCKVDMGAFEFQYVYLPLAINAQPATSSVVCAGTSVTVPVSVSGTVQGYQWYKDSFANPVAGQTTATLTLSNPQTGDAGSYSLVVTSTCNSFTSTGFSLTVNARPTRFYVNASAVGANTGLSWSDAFTSLQSALTYSCSQSLTEIWVAAGTYKPTTSTTNRNASFALRNGVAIYGGFVGNETTLSARPAINPVGGSGGASQPNAARPSSTTLSGDINQDGQPVGNSYHVLSNSDINTTAVLDGFVITGGAADQKGGGMLNDGSSPTIRNCVFQSNSASGSSAYGGAMVNNSSSPTIINCVFLSNSVSGGTTSQGGAMHNTNSNPKLTNCVFLNNSVSGATATFGGAMFNESNSNPQLTNCSFLSNSVSGGSSNFGGAMANTSNSSPQLINCVVFGNGGSSTFSNASSSIAATYSLFDNTVTGYSTDPSNLTTSTSPFASPTSVSLATNSPAIDAGLSSASGLSGILTDLAGNPRIVGCRVDMGALEFQDNTNQTLAITRQPASALAVCVGTSVTVPVSVSGTALAYQWYNGAGAISSQTSATLSLSNPQPGDGGSYSLVVSGTCNSLTSTAFSLTVNALPTVSITADPSATVTQGSPLTLTLSNTGATSFIWNTSSTNSFIVLNPTTSATYSATARSGAGCVASASLAITVTGPACNPVIFVTQLGDGLRDGSSWGNALSGNQLQIAINAAANCGGTGQVWVATGLYKPTTTTGPDSRTISFSLRNGVSIYGGFVGSETTLSDRPALNPVAGLGGASQPNAARPSSTTLSGDIGTVGNGTDNSFHVINNPASLSLTTTAVLDGFVITGGAGSALGGGIFNDRSSPTIRNCSFLTNSVTTSGTAISRGGGMYNGNGSNPQLTNCFFRSNTASSSGGFNGFGGAIANFTNSSPLLINCSFQANSVSGSSINYGGAMANTTNCSPQLTNCSFLNNSVSGSTSSPNYGGAMANTTNCSPQLTNCSFLNNSVSGSTSSPNYGGAMANTSSSPKLTNCSFLSNTVSGGTNSPIQGGAIFNTSNSSPQLTNCSFLSNTGRGGAMANVNNTSSPQLTNCVVFGNGGINTVYNSNSPSIAATYSLFDNTVTGYSTDPTNLTTSTSPFASSTSVSLATNSPAIDAGLSSASGLSGILTDLAGNPRIAGCRVDMGALEFQDNTNQTLSITQQPASALAVCVGTSVMVPVSVSGTALAYQWYNGAGAISSQTSATLSLSNPQPGDGGSYSLVVSGTCNSLTSNAFSLTVNALPTVSITADPSLTITQGSSTTLTASGGAGQPAPSYSWSSGQASAAISVSVAGTYSVTGTSSGCSSTTSVVVSVTAAGPTIAQLATSLSAVCAGSPVSFTASISNVSGSYAYTLTNGIVGAPTGTTTTGSSSNTAFSQNLIASGAGVQFFTLTVSSNGQTITATTSLTVNALPLLALNPSSLTLTQASPTASLSALGTGSYLWSTGETSSVISVTASGLYSVTLTNAGGCSSSATAAVFGADLTVNLILPQANFAAVGSVGNFVVNVFEVGGLPTSSGTVRITVTAPIGYTLAFPASLTSIPVSGGSVTPVDNGQWTVTQNLTNRQLTLTMSSGAFIGAGGKSSLGFQLTRTTANSGSTSSITVNVGDDLTMTYDGNMANNVYARVISGL